ncbi:nuclear protein [Steccherinum ochraceum]|uniref:Non-structural maintenance of chromosomes element 4 n=1 Tax=Steccherinum ochraceum TaxID=92696 RepID=A0A4R0S1G5_9APHY|nr:nuclear protein [Steccherinum ochraceum]
MSTPAKKKIRMDDGEDGAMVYDPDQDKDEVRGIRSTYRDIKQDLTQNPAERTTDELYKKVLSADDEFDHVKGTSEALMDSQVIRTITEEANSKVRQMKSGSGAFDVEEFLQKLITFMGGRREAHLDDDGDDDDEAFEAANSTDVKFDWEAIGRKALVWSHRVPVSDFMLGPLSIEQKQRVVAKRAKLEKNKADEKKPQAITEDDITRSENETTKNVTALNKLLEHYSPVNLFRFVLNPSDFAQSVENLFYLSFLIRDGDCALNINEEGEPEIYACQRPSKDEYDNGLRKQQLVLELDMATWRRAIEVFDIKEPLIPQRPKAATRIGNKWYG